MAKHILIAFGSPVAGREADYNMWYEQRHMHDVMAIPGFISARRFRINAEVSPAAKNANWQYAAIYEFESNDVKATLRELRERAGTAAMPLSDAADPHGAAMIVAASTAG